MPLVRHGPLKGLYFPDYGSDCCVVNLLASVIRSLGGNCPHKVHPLLPPSFLRSFRRIVYVAIDGLGLSQLRRFLNSGLGENFFGVYHHKPLSTVFPATTATAVTTLLTGASPREHAIVGWFLHLPSLGTVSTILESKSRTKAPVAPADYDLGHYLKIPSYLKRLRCRRELLIERPYGQSRFNHAAGLWPHLRSFRTLRGMYTQICRFAERSRSKLAFAYWPQLDSLCHKHGCFSRRVREHFRQVDSMLGALARRLEGTKTALLVLADHGVVDCPQRHRMDLARVPGFYNCLATLPAGDPRHVICFVRSSRKEAFLQCVRRHLGAACVCVPGEFLLAEGAFGPGKDHPALAQRIGDWHLIARDSFAFPSSVPHMSAPRHRGNHGGMSPEEILVPLYMIPPSPRWEL